jgi:hypothetical protein
MLAQVLGINICKVCLCSFVIRVWENCHVAELSRISVSKLLTSVSQAWSVKYFMIYYILLLFTHNLCLQFLIGYFHGVETRTRSCADHCVGKCRHIALLYRLYRLHHMHINRVKVYILDLCGDTGSR